MHEDVSGLVHVPVETVVVGGDLAVVVDIPGRSRRKPAGGRFQVGADWPGQHLKKTHLCKNVIMFWGSFVGCSVEVGLHLHGVIRKSGLYIGDKWANSNTAHETLREDRNTGYDNVIIMTLPRWLGRGGGCT